MYWGRIIEETIKDFNKWRQQSGYGDTAVMMLQFLEAKGYLKTKKLASKFYKEDRSHDEFPHNIRWRLMEGCVPADAIILPKKRKRKRKTDPFFTEMAMKNLKEEIKRNIEFAPYTELPIIKDIGGPLDETKE